MKEEKKPWSGYSYDELKFRCILNATKIELEKNVINERIENIRGGHMFANKGGWLTKAAGALNYVDYAAMAFGLFKRISSIFGHRRKKYRES